MADQVAANNRGGENARASEEKGADELVVQSGQVPHRMRITSQGSIKNYVQFALQFLQVRTLRSSIRFFAGMLQFWLVRLHQARRSYASFVAVHFSSKLNNFHGRCCHLMHNRHREDVRSSSIVSRLLSTRVPYRQPAVFRMHTPAHFPTAREKRTRMMRRSENESASRTIAQNRTRKRTLVRRFLSTPAPKRAPLPSGKPKALSVRPRLAFPRSSALQSSSSASLGEQIHHQLVTMPMYLPLRAQSRPLRLNLALSNRTQDLVQLPQRLPSPLMRTTLVWRSLPTR